MLKRIATSWLPWVVSIFVAFGALAVPFWLATREHSARGTFATDNLIVHNVSTLTGRTSIQSLNYSPADNIGPVSPEFLDDWSPPGLQTHTPLVIMGEDDTGTRITGIDSTGINVGDVRTICNLNGTNDDSNVSILNLSTRSLPANRILTPGAGEHTVPTVADYYIGPDECRDVQYSQPDTTDLTFKVWIVKDAPRRFESVVMQAMQFYHPIFPVAITGTLTDYNPVDNAPFVCNPGAVPCSEAGNNGTWQSNSVVILSTVDATGAVINGMVYTNGQADTLGPVKYIYNFGPGPIRFVNTSGIGGAENQFILGNFGNQDDVVLNPGRAPIALFHQRDNGGWLQLGHRDYQFDERDINMQHGLTIWNGGANSIPNIALLIPANPNSGVYLGFGGTIPFHYVNALDDATGGPFAVGTSLTVSGGAFTGGALQHICDGRAPTGVSAGVLFAGATNCKGRITGIGASSTTLTFSGGGAGISADCSLTLKSGGPAQIVTSDDNQATPTFSCLDSTTGAPANCPDISYSCWWH